MIRGRSPDDICALCDEFTRKDMDPAYEALGMGICKKRVDTPIYPTVYVPWDQYVCISFRLDRPNLAKRRQYVAQQKRAAEDAKNK